jgi:LacI family transcriptional regulator
MKKVSLTDIASVLNVSETLVSFVLNGHGDRQKIGKETQKRVKETAKKLNYRPNQLARGLRTGKTQTIGLIVTDISNVFYAKIAKEVEKTALQKGYTVIFCSSDENPETEIRLINMLMNKHVDGIIVSSSQKNAGFFRQLESQSFPFVLIDRRLPRFNAHYVGSDNFKGTFNATQRLIMQGRCRIGLLKITPNYISSMREREEGYRAAIKENNLRISNKIIASVKHDQINKDVEMILEGWLKEEILVDSILSLNNSITASCLKILKQKYRSAMDQISIVSFDDIDLFGLSEKPVSSIAQSIPKIGEKAVHLLIEDINQAKFDKQQICLPVHFTERNQFIENHNYQHEIV